jgi:transposase
MTLSAISRRLPRSSFLPSLRQRHGPPRRDVTEALEYVPGRYRVIRHVRPKFTCTAYNAIT